MILPLEERAAFREAVRSAAGWAHIASDEKRGMLDEILGTIESVYFPGAVIPRMVRRPLSMVYYAVADNERDWRMLAGLLRSFVGFTLTDYRGLKTDLDPADEFEALLAKHLAGRPLARFTPGGDKALERPAVEALLRMVRLVERERRVKRTRPRSTREVLREFRLALASGNDQAAGEALDFLRQNLRLDAINLFFLEVERLKAQGDWEGLARAKFFPDLAKRRRPPGVTNAMLEALYRTEVAPLVEAGDLARVTEAFQDKVRIPYPGLLLVLPPNPSVGAALLFLLEAYLQHAPDSPAVDAIQGLEPRLTDAERALVAQIMAALVPGASEHSDGVGAGSEVRPTTAEEAFRVVVQALEANSLSAYKHAVDCVTGLPDAEREIFLSSRAYRVVWDALNREFGVQEAPTSWPKLIEMLPTLTYAQLRSLAQRAQDEWPVGQHLPDAQSVNELTTAIQVAVSGEWKDKAIDLLPYIVKWVVQDEDWPNSAYLPLYEALLDCLFVIDKHPQAVLDAISTLVYGCLKIGLAPGNYERLLADLAYRVEQVAAPSTADWLLDLGEQLVLLPCADEEARANFWLRVQDKVRGLVSRLHPDQRALFLNISEAVGVPYGTGDEPIADEEQAVPFAGTIAVYTLQESVANRVREVLKDSYPHLRVEICTDLVATARVKHLARSADYFVICWQDAKHAVTRAVTQLRPENKPIVWAPGGGSAGVLRAIRECLAREAGGRPKDSAA